MKKLNYDTVVVGAGAAGIGAALALYCAVLPALNGFAELGAVIFVICFAMAWLFPEPEQGMARMGLLVPVFVLSGMGGEHFAPQQMLSGGVGLICAALGAALIFSILDPSEKEEGRVSEEDTGEGAKTL